MEQRQGVTKCDRWYQSKFLRLSAKVFGGGEWLKASGLGWTVAQHTGYGETQGTQG
jgi:hypothetical protein